MADVPPLTMHDALLVNLVGAILVDPLSGDELLAEHIAGVAEALPRVMRDGLRMADLARAAEALVAAYPGRRRRASEGEPHAWSRARFDAGVALAVILRWRAAQAHAQLYAAEGAP